MKKILLVSFVFVLNYVQAQLEYKLTHTTATYTEITSSTDISNNVWSGGHTMPMPFVFEYFDVAYSNINIASNGCYFSDSGVDYLTFTSDNVMPEDKNSALSPVSYNLSGMSPNRILKIQWKNIKDSDIDTSSYEYVINIQLWFYENGSHIEYHFGNTSITDPGYNTNYIGLIDFDNSPYLAIDSSAANPVLVRVINAGTFNGIPTYPVNGQVYKLTPATLVSIPTLSKPYTFHAQNSSFEIHCNGDYTIDIIDINGKTTGQAKFIGRTSGKHELKDLSPGIYMVNIRIGNQFFTEKLVLR